MNISVITQRNQNFGCDAMIDYDLPVRYSPYRELDFCSNRLIGVHIPIVVHENPVLLLGTGSYPLVWLAAPIEPGARRWGYIVKESKSVNPAVNVHVDKRQKSVHIRIEGKTVLFAQANSSSKATVSQLDLRPIGLAVYGDRRGLYAGGMSLASNTFENVHTAFAFGEPGK